MATVIFVIIASIVVWLIFTAINKAVRKATAYKDTDITTELKEFRESHAVAKVINRGSLDLKESIVQRYERMCITEPLKHKGDASIPQLIADYKDIILGKVLDPQGLNIPSEVLLGVPNPDYKKYVSNQARALEKASMLKPSKALKDEERRVVRLKEEENVRSQFIADLVCQGVPALTASAAASDAKLNTYTADDWKKFCKVVQGYVSISDSLKVMRFVELFDEKEIIFDSKKYERFLIFIEYGIPNEILCDLIRDRITPEQAIRIITLVQEHKYQWSEAFEEILKEDIDKSQANDLRKSYGWEGI